MQPVGPFAAHHLYRLKQSQKPSPYGGGFFGVETASEESDTRAYQH